jgi:hypothetical protein
MRVLRFVRKRLGRSRSNPRFLIEREDVARHGDRLRMAAEIQCRFATRCGVVRRIHALIAALTSMKKAIAGEWRIPASIDSTLASASLGGVNLFLISAWSVIASSTTMGERCGQWSSSQPISPSFLRPMFA